MILDRLDRSGKHLGAEPLRSDASAALALLRPKIQGFLDDSRCFRLTDAA
ncbi:MAG: hypothetical protein JW741_09045 [Sedimentisphaerales bacterium]|nr:hypothetical protein [Sedimentisphaerales bacterium]